MWEKVVKDWCLNWQIRYLKVGKCLRVSFGVPILCTKRAVGSTGEVLRDYLI